MIELNQVSKSFGEVQALQNITLSIPEGKVFGLLGTNGAGKSTLLRVLAGILKADEGTVEIDGKPISDDAPMKRDLFYLSDDPYYFPNATPEIVKQFYRSIYPKFDTVGFDEMINRFQLDPHRKIRTFSKGMKRQTFIIASVCANTKYILCDEVFDGLDPIVARVVRRIFESEMKLRGLTLVVASHNLRELDGFCSSIGIVHKGGIVLAKETETVVTDLRKVQCVFQGKEEAYLKKYLQVIKYEKAGMFVTILARGSQEEILKVIRSRNPVCYEIVPLSLEEVFIAEMEVSGYDISKVIF